MELAFISVCFGFLVVGVWYWAFLHLNRRRALRVLNWIEGAIITHGQVSGVDWISPSHFRARLRLSGTAFRQPFLEARLAPREMPVRWAAWHWRHCQETLTFEANLNCPPQRNIEIIRTRWLGPLRRCTQYSTALPTLAVASLYLSTQPEWEPEISNPMTTVKSTREFEFLEVSFCSHAPHFSVTFSLRETLKHESGELAIFDSLRELAESSPTSRT
ncbi:MAG: hypothetical protein CXZ00_11180 [Acidobacteria bacterium]|nr:MAG: hypothetical protein CXZ00_11180 [Acidobacteriota bacterium]